MTNRAEFERLLDVYGFRCERFGQDLSTHARAQVVSAFAALASAPVAGVAQPTDEQIHRLAFDSGVVFGNTEEGAECWEFESPSLREFALALLSRHSAPQASEAVRDAALEEAAQATYLALFPKNPRSDWTDYAKDSAAHAEHVVQAISALKTQADKDGGDCAKGAGDERGAFEQWATASGRRGNFKLRDGDGYADGYANSDWHVWQACVAALAAQKQGDSDAH